MTLSLTISGCSFDNLVFYYNVNVDQTVLGHGFFRQRGLADPSNSRCSIFVTVSQPYSAFSTTLNAVVDSSVQSDEVIVGKDFLLACQRGCLPWNPSSLPPSPYVITTNAEELPDYVGFPPVRPSEDFVESKRKNSASMLKAACSTSRSYSTVSAVDPSTSTSITRASTKPRSQSLIETCFFNSYQSGARCTIFLREIDPLQRYARLHGFQSPCIVTRQQCFSLLIRHLLNGECYSSSDAACQLFSADFKSKEDLSSTVIDIVTRSPAHKLSNERLRQILQAMNVPTDFRSRNTRREMIRELSRLLAVQREPRTIDELFDKFQTHSRAMLLHNCLQHGMEVDTYTATKQSLRENLCEHIAHGVCFSNVFLSLPDTNSSARTFPGCQRITSSIEFTEVEGDRLGQQKYLQSLLTEIKHTLSRSPLQSILGSLKIVYETGDTIKKLRQRLTWHINGLERKIHDSTLESTHEIDEQIRAIQLAWPVVPSEELKNRAISDFRSRTSSRELKTVTCGSCAASYPVGDCRSTLVRNIDLSPLQRPVLRPGSSPTGEVIDKEWFNSALDFHASVIRGYPDVLVDSRGVIDGSTESNEQGIQLCKECLRCIKDRKVPPLSLANHLYLGDVPDVLKDLSVVEEAMISLCRAKSWIIRMKEDSASNLPNCQRGLKGHIIVFPQRPSAIAKLLPPSLEELQAPICVIFVGSQPPTKEWMQKYAKPLSVRPGRVKAALEWLLTHNPLYHDVAVDNDLLDSLPDQFNLPVHIEHVPVGSIDESLTSGYDPLALTSEVPESSHNFTPEISFDSVTIADVDPNASPADLQAAAVRHFENRKSYVELYHDPKPVNEFAHPQLFPMIYPTLFPYGIGGFEHPDRSAALSMKRQVKHFLSLTDRRFQEHYSFPFTAFNIIQRRELLLRTSLKAKKSGFKSLAARFATISCDAIRAVSERLAKGDNLTFHNEQERTVLSLMREVSVITSHVPGSSSSLVNMRNEIRGLMIEEGLPSFYLTINPADVFNPVVKFLAGEEIDVDNLLPDQVPEYWEQSILVARNPVVAAQFFNVYVKAFISTLLGYNAKKFNLNGGVLGVVKGYYGCIEAQGRGSLHSHMLIWLEGALNPNEIKERALALGEEEFRKRLLDFLDDTISNSVPPDSDTTLLVPSSIYHPCSVRGVSPQPEFKKARQRDLHHLVKQCQLHRHTATCYKYCKSSDPRECRFNLDEKHIQPISVIDNATGELSLRCLDGLVNNFNDSIIEAIRCNMDIKFIGSGASAKAVLYYITNYITKSQLKAHVAYAALARAVDKLNECEPENNLKTVRAKKLLQKCAFALISEQELSAQQVCTYLLELDDHFTSHKYNMLFWSDFETHLDNEYPSPECRMKARPLPSERENHEDTNEEQSSLEQDELDTPDSDDEEEIPTDNHDEIAIAVEETGKLTRCASQVEDYVLRSSEFEHINLWQFVSRCEKIRIKRKPKDEEEQTTSDRKEDRDLGSSIAIDQSNDISPETTEIYGKFSEKHPEFRTHVLRVRPLGGHRVPVPIGPALPRRDRDETRAKYCRLMLIFFKPWRTALSLREKFHSWPEAFNNFLSSCPDSVKRRMDNMQIMHECRDSRDDHFAELSKARRNRNRQLFTPQERTNGVEDDFAGGGDIELDILEHMESINSAFSIKAAQAQSEVMACLENAEMSGMFDVFDASISKDLEMNLLGSDSTAQREPNVLPEEQNIQNSEQIETEWEAAYESRRQSYWKQKATESAHSSTISVPNEVVNESRNQRIDELRSGSKTESHLVPGASLQSSTVEIGVDEFLASYPKKLTSEQETAFRIIANQSVQHNTEPLSMYLGGAGGTGKSLVITALRNFFERRGQSRRFRLTSYTGVAARNISGMTLHSALYIDQISRMKANSKSHRDLISLWEGVDFMFVDEVSMLGCKFLCKISQSLNKAKQNLLPFGGINVIFAGDFSQLEPVGDRKLFWHVPTSSVPQTVVFGKILWLSITTVVILRKSIRQEADISFSELLNRMRYGMCTVDDYEVLKKRRLSQNIIDWRDPSWRNAPIIVATNSAKDALNEKAAEAFAAREGHKLHWYYASDQRNGKEIVEPGLKKHLWKLDAAKTCYRSGRIPLVVGMPVMIMHNYDVPAGIVNGCKGILRKIRFRVDKDGHRHAISCVVDAPSTTSVTSMPYLEHNKLVVTLEDTVTMKFADPFTHKQCTFKRTQVPIVPAFAMTAHKAQGQTMNNVIVDLQGCRKTEPPYVMCSRATSLGGLLVLRDFSIKKIQCHQSEDLRNEIARLDYLANVTLARQSGPDVKKASKELLASYASSSTSVDCNLTVGKSSFDMLNDLQRSWLVTHSSIPQKRKSPTTNIKRSLKKRRVG